MAQGRKGTSNPKYTKSVLVKLTQGEYDSLVERSDSVGVSLSEAFRKGADLWLTSRELDSTPLAAEDQELVADVYALAHKIDRSLRGSS